MQSTSPRNLPRGVMSLALATVLSATVGIATMTNSSPATAASAVPSYSVAVAGESWTITNPTGCSETIGAGGNYEGDSFLQGKCQGAGQEPTKTGSAGSIALTFRTKKDFRYNGAIVEDAAKNTWQDANGDTLRDRTELATGWNLPLGTDVWIGFDVRIPAGVGDVTGSGAYVMQLWQCTANPIAGVRIQSGAGNGHNLQFVRRADETVPDENYDISMATKSVGTDQWHSFVIRYNAKPYYGPGSPKGSIDVYHRRVGATTVETKLIDNRAEYFGYSDKCTNDKYKVKFGMYKDYQPGETFRADFRNLRIGGSKAAVQPYYRD